MKVLIKHYLISGRVQGVGYRAFAHRQAQKLGLVGWVRNLEDGRVEALAEGTEANLAQFAQALHQGPALARVENVAINPWSEPLSMAQFEVRKDGTQPCA